MLSKNILPYCIALLAMFQATSCKKYLDTKSVQNLSSPQTLDDLQLILNNQIWCYGPAGTYNGTDEYYLTFQDWQTRSEFRRKSYVWDPLADNYSDWVNQYKTVFAANTVLFNLDFVDATGKDAQKNQIRGSALFFRAFSFYQLAQVYAPQYDPVTAASDPGIVLRLNADINETSVRGTVQQSYDRIIADLQEASAILPETTVSVNQPNKAACYALLARVYLQTGNYQKAKESADASLQRYDVLLDYNTLLPVNNFFPFPFKNPEILFYSYGDGSINVDYTRAKADTILYKSYAVNDIRKDAFFKDNLNGSYAFRGNYTGEDFTLFNGLATDEVYLTRSEALARLGNVNDALEDLNTLLQKRWLAGTFVPLTAGNADQALTMILEERRKELVNRGTRWSDLRRLNKDSRFAVTLTRVLNGETYSLAPNDLRYTYLIPKDVIHIVNLPQNPR